MGVENISGSWVSGDLYFHRTDTMATIVKITDDYGSNVNLGLVVQGVAAGYKLARGNATFTANATVVTGLTAVVDFVLGQRNQKADADTANNCCVYNGSISGGSLILRRYAASSATRTVVVDATTAGTIDWIAIGT